MTDVPSTDYAELRRLAERAAIPVDRYDDAFTVGDRVAPFKKAATPATILALLDEREDAIIETGLKAARLSCVQLELDEMTARAEKAEAEAARLREALKPFAAEAIRWHEMGDTRQIRSDTDLVVGDLRAAARALGGAK